MTYDNNGNLQTITDSSGTTTYIWNARNQLVGISGPGMTASFVYDGFGRREKKTINGSVTEFLYDGVNPVQETSGAAILANILPGLGIDEFLTRTDVVAGVTSNFLTDALGSPIAVTDNSGVVQTEYTYEPFGKTTFTGSSNSNPYQYTGRENDGTGLYFYRGRYYSPQFQRFIAEDPIGFLGDDMNLYAYVGNDPISFVDPSGLGRIKIVRRIGSWLRESRSASVGQAQNARRRGADVIAPDARTARQIEQGAFKRDPSAGDILKHEPHQPGYRGHYQTAGKPGHTFFGALAVPGADIGDIVGEATGSELLGGVVDFFNPLSDLQDILDMSGSLFDYFLGRRK